MKKLQPSFWKIELTKDWRESDVFLVFCPVKTRPGADVDAAMRNLPGEIFLQADLPATCISKGDLVVRASHLLSPSLSSGDRPVLLVVMYHTLHVEHSSDLRRWSNNYKNVKFHVDVLFHETVPGLLKCPQNKDAIELIKKTLKSYRQRR